MGTDTQSVSRCSLRGVPISGVLFWMLIESGTRTLYIYCLILDTHLFSVYLNQIWKPRIADLVFYTGYSSNMAPAHCRFGILF